MCWIVNSVYPFACIRIYQLLFWQAHGRSNPNKLLCISLSFNSILAIGQEQTTSNNFFFVYNSTSTSQTRANLFRRDRRHVTGLLTAGGKLRCNLQNKAVLRGKRWKREVTFFSQSPRFKEQKDMHSRDNN